MDLLIEGHLQRVADRLETDDSLQRSLIHAWVWDEVANLVEVLIRQHCVKHRISIPEQRDLSLGSDDE